MANSTKFAKIVTEFLSYCIMQTVKKFQKMLQGYI
jgi:hypothetical protein